jgi:hypothetical protein
MPIAVPELLIDIAEPAMGAHDLTASRPNRYRLHVAYRSECGERGLNWAACETGCSPTASSINA